MTFLGVLFLILYVLAVVGGGWCSWPRGSGPYVWWPFGGYVVVLILIGILGYEVFVVLAGHSAAPLH